MKIFKFLLLSLLVCGCGKGDSPEPEKPPEKQYPKPVLVTPAVDELCNTGTVISANETEVTFKWDKVDGATSYTLLCTNLLTAQQATKTALTSTSTNFALQRSTPYRWTVIAQFENNRSTEGEPRRFYNAGPATTSTAPYPAYLTAPELGQKFSSAGNVDLQWKGASAANNALNYDIYYGKSANPPLFLSGTTSTSFKVTTTANSIYYWKVITRDNNGNTSESYTYQFSVQ